MLNNRLHDMMSIEHYVGQTIPSLSFVSITLFLSHIVQI